MPEAIATPGKPMHILVSGIAWPPEAFLGRLLDGLLQKGMRITVATNQKPGKEWLERQGFSWLREPAWETGNILHLILNLGRAAVRAPKDLRLFYKVAAKEDRPKNSLAMLQRLLPYAGRRWDAIYFPWNSAAIERTALFDLGVPVVISCRGAQVNTAPYNPARADIITGLQATFKKATQVHCVSQDILHEALQWELEAEKAIVIRPAVDPHFFTPGPGKHSELDAFRIVSTGAFIWRKGYEYALLAIQQLKAAGIPVRYQVIGDGPERQRILYTIQDLGLQDCVQLLGKQPVNAVRDTLQQADAFLLSSLSEGIANVVLEAMACELPVVTTNCGGMREAVKDGVEGFVTPMRDPNAMAQALEKLWRDPALRSDMGKRGRKHVCDQFPLAGQINQFFDLFQELAESKNSQYDNITPENTPDYLR